MKEIQQIISDPVPKSFCVNCHSSAESLLKCGRCGLVKYCTKLCQRAHWQLHKDMCNFLGSVNCENSDNVVLEAHSLEGWTPFFINDFAKPFQEVFQFFSILYIILTEKQFCQKTAALAVLNLDIHHQIYIKTIFAAAKSYIRMKCEYKLSAIKELEEQQSSFEEHKKAVSLQIFNLESEVESLNKKLLKTVKNHHRERILMELANVEAAMECKQQMLRDSVEASDLIEKKLSNIRVLVHEDRWLKARASMEAEVVD